MGLTALDIVVLLAIGGSAALGFMRGFVTELLSLFAWVAIVFMLKIFHTPVTHALSAREQVGVDGASDAVLEALADGNRRYEERFGYIFIVCASGRTAAEMLAMLTARLGNDPTHELQIAAAEQAKITALRLV